MVAYCRQDIDLLCEVMTVYSESNIDLTMQHLQEHGDELPQGIEPLNSVTCAGYAMKVYCTLHMPADKLAMLTAEEWRFIKRGFKGRHTETCKLYQQWSEKDILQGIFGVYQDIVSLYPAVQYFDWLLCGVPTWQDVAEGEQIDLSDVFGYIELNLTPTDRTLHHDPIVTLQQGRLQGSMLMHSKIVLCSNKVQEAMKHGYCVDRVYRILHFEKCTDLFRTYINSYMRIKQESGDPLNEAAEEVQLHTMGWIPTHYAKNLGKKACAKLMLNLLWGKFGQSVDSSTPVYLQKPEDWYKLMRHHLKGEINICNDTLMGEALFVCYQDSLDRSSVMANTNVAMCGFVTSNV